MGRKKGSWTQKQHIQRGELPCKWCKPAPHRAHRHPPTHPPGPQRLEGIQQVLAEGPGVGQTLCLPTPHVGGGEEAHRVDDEGARPIKQHLQAADERCL